MSVYPPPHPTTPLTQADAALNAIGDADLFSGGSRDQVMLFSRPNSNSLPAYLISLSNNLEHLLEPLLRPDVLKAVFNQPLARQVILNLYPPGTGMSPHIDLPKRYADGILGISLIGGTVMTFTKPASDHNRSQRRQQRYEVYIPPRSLYVLTDEARWDWEHGIEGRLEDVVRGEDGRKVTILRDMRVSVTFRWMSEGADVLS